MGELERRDATRRPGAEARSRRRRLSARLRSDRGAASVLAVAVIGAVICSGTVAVALGGAFAARRVAAAAADAAALAAADVASGLKPGSPCQAAESVAAANAAQLLSCELEGVVAIVETSVSYLGLAAHASARAGPPGTQ